MSMTIVEIDRATYSKVIAGNSETQFFHKTKWLGAVGKCFKVNLKYLGISVDNNLIGAIPIMIRKVAAFSIAGAPLPAVATPSIPTFLPAGHDAETFRAIHHYFVSQDVHYFQIPLRPWPDFDGTQAKFETRYHYELPLAHSLNELWSGISSSHRGSIRKALSLGVRIHTAHSRDFVANCYYPMVVRQYESQGLNPQIPLAFYQSVFDNFLTGNMRLVFATLNGELLAAQWFLFDSHSIYYWDSASKLASRSTGANNLMMWTMIAWGHRKRLERLNFIGGQAGGRGGHRPGIGRFKAGFGASLTPYCVASFASPSIRALLYLYRGFLRIRDRPSRI